MADMIATVILPYSLVLGIAVAIIVSVLLIVLSLKKQSADNRILSRLSAMEAEVRKDAQKIEFQVIQTRHNLEPERGRSVMEDLSKIAADLQRRTIEMQAILNDLRSANARSESIEATKRLASVGIGVGETEHRIKSLLNKIEREQQELNDLNSVDAVGQN